VGDMAQEVGRILIDTSALIAHLRGRLALQDLLGGYEEIYISSITLYELEYGATKAGRASDFDRLAHALRPAVLEVGHSEAQRAARVNGELARQNRQIGPRDALIAGTALERDLCLLTLNLVEFQRVPGLRLVGPA